jgi:hypothetical protein
MSTFKRIAVLLVELVVEALLFGSLFGVLLSLNQSSFWYAMMGSIMAVPVILCLHGYYISRLLAAIALARRAKWLYPAAAALAFFAHVLFVIVELGPHDLTPHAQAMRVPFLIGGTCIVFGCAFAGKKLFQKWSLAHPPIPNSISPL